MTKDKLVLAKDLSELIDNTKKALQAVNNWIEKSKKLSTGCAYNIDYNYFFNISEHSDGSGDKVCLTRYFGNTEILKIIRDKVAEQLEKYESDFSAM